MFIITVVFSFSYGIAVGSFKFQPYGIFNSVYDQFVTNNHEEQNNVISLYSKVNVTSLIHISSQTDVLDKRMQLIQYIWKQNFPHDKMPSNIENDIKDDRYSDLQNLSQINKITTSMEYGVNSYSYLFLADKSNNKLVVYHQGHDGDFILGKKTIQSLLDKEYSVLALSMPFTGMNNQPVVDLPNFGKLKLVTHDDLIFIDSEKFSSIKFFVEPVAVSLNYVDVAFNFDSYYMIGISGGGWTAALYSAIDPRIDKSYPVAGSVPMYLRFNNPNNTGDYEQTLPELYRIADYLDLYIMASYGENREQLQIFNKYDPCCFAGDSFTTYENEIKNTLSKLGAGTFTVYLDDTHKEHKISEHALNLIINNMNN